MDELTNRKTTHYNLKAGYTSISITSFFITHYPIILFWKHVTFGWLIKYRKGNILIVEGFVVFITRVFNIQHTGLGLGVAIQLCMLIIEEWLAMLRIQKYFLRRDRDF